MQVHGDLLCLAALDGLLIAGAVDGTLRLWDLAKLASLGGDLRKELEQAEAVVVQAHEGRVTGLVVATSGVDPADMPAAGEERTQSAARQEGQARLLVTCGHDGYVRSWSLARGTHGTCHVLLNGQVDLVASLGLHAAPDERLLCLAASPVPPNQAMGPAAAPGIQGSSRRVHRLPTHPLELLLLLLLPSRARVLPYLSKDVQMEKVTCVVQVRVRGNEQRHRYSRRPLGAQRRSIAESSTNQSACDGKPR